MTRNSRRAATADRPTVLLRGPARSAFGQAAAASGPPQGSVINVGRYSGWSLGQIKRHDPEFLEWLMRVPAGRQYRDDIRAMLGQRAHQ